MSLETIRLYAIAKLGWIKEQQRKLREQEREAPREYLDLESHYLWGTRYLLDLQEIDQPPRIELQHRNLLLTVRPGSDVQKRAELLAAWYREQLRAALPALFEKWQARLNVQPGRIHIRHMKTRWGSCNPATRGILLNTELAKKPQSCLEYVIVHELIHLIEPTHNQNFIAHITRQLPNWRLLRDELNQAPLAHENWDY
jgi:predicted metal-dependent hydrolase